MDCNDCRTMSLNLLDYVSKIFLKIIMERIDGKVMNYGSMINMFDFREVMGTRMATGTMRMLCERRLRNDVYISFVDFEKVFECEIGEDGRVKIRKSIGAD